MKRVIFLLTVLSILIGIGPAYGADPIRPTQKVKKAAPPQEAKFFDTIYHALIIGNNQYKYLPKLKTARNDAVEVERLLKEKFKFQTELLLDATRADILDHINELRKKLGEKDNLLIYYAGHGENDKTVDKSYWLPIDAQRDNPTNWIMADDITSNIKRIAARHVLVVSDSCYSGTLARQAVTELISTGGRDEFLKKMIERPSRTLMASGGNEPVSDSGGGNNSVFAAAFLKTLKETDKEVFTAEEIFHSRIKEIVAGRSDQVPEYSNIKNSGHEGGDFVFRLARLSVEPIKTARDSLDQSREEERIRKERQELAEERARVEAEKKRLEEQIKLDKERIKIAEDKILLETKKKEAEQQRWKKEEDQKKLAEKEKQLKGKDIKKPAGSFSEAPSISNTSTTMPSRTGKPIKIGVIGPMNFSQGKAQWNGATLAAEDVNASGGVQVGDEKRKIELVKTDSNEFLNVADATNAMERLMTKDKVDFVVGGFRTEAVLPMQDIAMDYKKIFISCGAAHPELCLRVAKDYKRYKYFFRGAPFNANYLFSVSSAHLAFVGEVIKKDLNVPVKCAIVVEKAPWADSYVEGIKGILPKLGIEMVGIWRPSSVASDVKDELKAIKKSGANMIFTLFSSSVGISFARQAGELKVPAIQVGINVEAQKDGFWEATKGMGGYVVTQNHYIRGVEQTTLTKSFLDRYIKEFKETPAYTADTYSTIIHALVPSIEAVESLDADKIVAHLEFREYNTTSGKVKYMRDAQGNHLHDLTWGAGYLTSLGGQWQDGQFVGVWPNKWKASPNSQEVTYEGMVPLKLPPWMKEKKLP